MMLSAVDLAFNAGLCRRLCGRPASCARSVTERCHAPSKQISHRGRRQARAISGKTLFSSADGFARPVILTSVAPRLRRLSSYADRRISRFAAPAIYLSCINAVTKTYSAIQRQLAHIPAAICQLPVRTWCGTPFSSLLYFQQICYGYCTDRIAENSRVITRSNIFRVIYYRRSVICPFW